LFVFKLNTFVLFLQVSYIVFLLLYSILLLTNFYPTISSEEIVLIIWIVTIVCEEFRQVGQ